LKPLPHYQTSSAEPPGGSHTTALFRDVGGLGSQENTAQFGLGRQTITRMAQQYEFGPPIQNPLNEIVGQPSDPTRIFNGTDRTLRGIDNQTQRR
jgi:hypothetical protein